MENVDPDFIKTNFNNLLLYILINDMKKIVIIIIAFFLLTGCANNQFILFGVDVNEMKGKDFGVAMVGATASVLTHIAGHYVAAELCDVKIDQDGFAENVDFSNNPSSSDLRWFARGGFLLQHIVNTTLIKFHKDSYFTKGYTGMTCVELFSYGIRHPDNGDFNFIDEHNGNGNLEYGMFGLWSAYNLYDLSKVNIDNPIIGEKL